MSRALWFAAGAGAGAYALTRARRAAEALTVDGLRDRLGAMAVGARMLREEIHAGQVEKEDELRERFGLVTGGPPQLSSSTPPAARRLPTPITTPTPTPEKDTH